MSPAAPRFSMPNGAHGLSDRLAQRLRVGTLSFADSAQSHGHIRRLLCRHGPIYLNKSAMPEATSARLINR